MRPKRHFRGYSERAVNSRQRIPPEWMREIGQAVRARTILLFGFRGHRYYGLELPRWVVTQHCSVYRAAEAAQSPVDMALMCCIPSHVKTTTVRELRNNYSKVLKWVSKGEEVEVTRRGKIVAKVIPPPSAKAAEVDWSQSAALSRRVWSTTLTAHRSAAILADSQGN